MEVDVCLLYYNVSHQTSLGFLILNAALNMLLKNRKTLKAQMVKDNWGSLLLLCTYVYVYERKFFQICVPQMAFKISKEKIQSERCGERVNFSKLKETEAKRKRKSV